jgi:hypothetical protein
MSRLLPVSLLMVLLLFPSDRVRGAEPTKSSEVDRIQVAPTDWPWWRGPNRNE